MSAETEGRALMAFLAGLAGALGALADHATSQAAVPEVGDALDDVVRGLQHGERAVRQALAAVDAADPFVAQMPKIIREVMGDYQACGTALSTWWSTCLSRRRAELERQQQVEGDNIVEKVVSRGAR